MEKITVQLRPGDTIKIYGRVETVTGVELSPVGDCHVATDLTPMSEAHVVDAFKKFTVIGR